MVLGLPSHNTHNMRLNTLLGLAVVAAFAGVLSGCGQSSMSPTSPSLLSSQAAEDTPRPGVSLSPRRVDNDGDGYEDPETEPPRNPGTGDTPNPDQVPPPAGLPVPTQLTINVVGLLGNLSFAPNPLQAAIGNIIVWTNNDFLPHDIVLDDGTPVGNLTPGQSSLPITLAAETVGYHCTIHPSMVGQITSMPTGEPVPTDPSRNPTPDPNRSPSPDPYGDGDDNGGDGYVDYY